MLNRVELLIILCGLLSKTRWLRCDAQIAALRSRDGWQCHLSNSRTDEIKDLLQFGKEVKVFLGRYYSKQMT
jgi:hypothetical protein